VKRKELESFKERLRFALSIGKQTKKGICIPLEAFPELKSLAEFFQKACVFDKDGRCGLPFYGCEFDIQRKSFFVDPKRKELFLDFVMSWVLFE